MKNKKLLILPFLALILTGCKPTPSSSTPPDSTGPDSSDTLPTIPVEVTPKRTIAEIRAMTADGASASETDKAKVFETKGIVTAKYRGAVLDKNPAWNIAIQEGSAALLLYAIDEATYAASFEKVKVGDELTVEGNLAAYNGLRELDKIKYISHKAGTAIAPEVLTSVAQAGLAGKDSKLVKIEGLKVLEKPTLVANQTAERTNITVNLKLAKEGDLANTLSTYMHYNITFADAEATVAKLSAVKSTDLLSWTGVLGMNGGKFQLTNANADEWVITAGAAPVASALAFDKVAFELDVADSVKRSVTVAPWDGPTTGLVFASSNDAIATIDSEGLVVGVSAGEATLTATLGLLTAESKVTVKAVEEVATKYVITPLRSDLEGVDKLVDLSDTDNLLKYSKGFPEGTVLNSSEKFSVSTGGGSSNTDSMPADYVVFKFSTSKIDATAKITLPSGTEVESVLVKGRGWNKDVATLAINGVVKDFKNPDGSLKEDIREFNYALPEVTNVLEFAAVKRLIVTEIVLNLKGGEVTPPDPTPVKGVVISEVYGGGGNTDAPYNKDFIELYNNTDEDVDLTGWAVWYASATGDFKNPADFTYAVNTVLSGVIKAKSYFLISASGGTTGEDLPKPDVVGELNMATDKFKVILTNSLVVPTKTLELDNLVDFVGAGTADLYEGEKAAVAPSNTQSIARVLVDGVMVDSDNNFADFVLGAPTPRNSVVV